MVWCMRACISCLDGADASSVAQSPTVTMIRNHLALEIHFGAQEQAHRRSGRQMSRGGSGSRGRSRAAAMKAAAVVDWQQRAADQQQRQSSGGSSAGWWKRRGAGGNGTAAVVWQQPAADQRREAAAAMKVRFFISQGVYKQMPRWVGVGEKNLRLFHAAELRSETDTFRSFSEFEIVGKALVGDRKIIMRLPDACFAVSVAHVDINKINKVVGSGIFIYQCGGSGRQWWQQRGFGEGSNGGPVVVWRMRADGKAAQE